MSAWASNSKGKGKGKGKAGSPEGGKGHLLPRTRLSSEKFSGTVVVWKGKYGFIKPGEEIEHEKASLHNGNLFACVDDLLGVQALEEGARVNFHISEDESGLVAEEVEQTGPGSPAPKGKGKTAKGNLNGGWGSSTSGGKVDSGKGSAVKGGSKSWLMTTQKPGQAMSKGTMSKGTISKGTLSKGADKGKGNGKAKGKTGKGHLLPRTRLSEEKFTGTVADWKGKYGWIEPSETIEHEKASKHGGKLFVGKDDLVGVEELTPGSAVEFHIWEDSSGLGADEVIQS